jgi:hypothetical protein
MFQAVQRSSSQVLPLLHGVARQSALFTELLDSNHDAWRVIRKDHVWCFYREVGDGESSLPSGCVVIKNSPGQSLRCDFYTSGGKQSLLNTYGDEIVRAAQSLVDREYIIALVTKSARGLGIDNWNHSLSFSGSHVTERCAHLRGGTSLYDRIVGSDWAASQRAALSHGISLSALRLQPGLVVSQRDNDVPIVRCLISYPRIIETTFASSRLRAGLYAVTEEMVSLVVENNRAVEEQWDFGSDCDL